MLEKNKSPISIKISPKNAYKKNFNIFPKNETNQSNKTFNSNSSRVFVGFKKTSE